MKKVRILLWMLAAAVLVGAFSLPQTAANADAAAKLTKIKLDKKTTTVKVGEKVKLKVKKTPKKAKATLRWKSSKKSIAKVNRKGVVTGVAPGTVKITVKARVGKKVLKATKKVTVVAADETAQTPQKTENSAAANTGSETNTETKNETGAADTRPRLIITQDAECDDMNSLLHALLYSNEIDIEGIVQTSSTLHYIGDPDNENEEYRESFRWPGTEWMDEMLDAYEEVYPNLVKHDSNYPTPEYLRSVTKVGNIACPDDVSEETDGSKLIEEALMADDDRTLYIAAGGGNNTTARALMSIEEKYKDTPEWDAIYKRISENTVIPACLEQDNMYTNYIAENWPDIQYINMVHFGTAGYAWRSSLANYEEAFETFTGKWMSKNLLNNHGALLEKYITWGDQKYLEGEPEEYQYGTNESLLGDDGSGFMGSHYYRYDFLSEGDSPTFYYLIDSGLRTLEDKTWGGYGGRYTKAENKTNSKGETLNYWNTASDYYAETEATTDAAVKYVADLQNDFAARADWCVTSDYSKANHAPDITVNDITDSENVTKNVLNITAAPGEKLKLKAITSDPDGDYVEVAWSQYADADSYAETDHQTISIKGSDSDVASFTIPEDAEDGDTIHIIAKATDDGEHTLVHYQRIVITVQKDAAAE